MVVYKGKGVYAAAAIGRASVFKRHTAPVSRVSIGDIAAELARLEAAKALATEQLTEIRDKALKEAGEENAEIFGIHIMMLDDEDYNDSITGMIETQKVNAEYAVAAVSDKFAEMFANMEDEYMRARSADIRDISDRLIACLTDSGGTDDVTAEKTVICADDLAPSEIVSLGKDRVLALVTAFGSLNSHTAILARSMKIPAVIGVGEKFLGSIADGDMLAVSGHTGEVFLSPDEATVKRLSVKLEEDARRKKLLRELKGRENVTLDGTTIGICANIDGAESIGDVLENDADGIGLFRSEFLYLGSEALPTEEQQFSAYRKVLEGMAGRRVIIRTLDIGADKQIDHFKLDKEENPALGLRAIRICLTRPEIFRTQLRALYRASAFGRLGIMFPMITSVSEVEQCLAVCDEVKKELDGEDVRYGGHTEIGIMIETPAAAVISDKLAPLVDFFSVGTNDLTQYTLACDRQNDKLGAFADPHHEAVLRLIEMSVRNAHANNTRIGICGELAADLTLTETFLRMGIDELSVSPPYVLPLRERVRSIDLRCPENAG